MGYRVILAAKHPETNLIYYMEHSVNRHSAPSRQNLVDINMDITREYESKYVAQQIRRYMLFSPVKTILDIQFEKQILPIPNKVDWLLLSEDNRWYRYEVKDGVIDESTRLDISKITVDAMVEVLEVLGYVEIDLPTHLNKRRQQWKNGTPFLKGDIFMNVHYYHEAYHEGFENQVLVEDAVLHRGVIKFTSYTIATENGFTGYDATHPSYWTKDSLLQTSPALRVRVFRKEE